MKCVQYAHDTKHKAGNYDDEAVTSMESVCVNCEKPFQTRKKGYKRKLLTNLPIPLINLNDILTKKIVLPLTPSKKYICDSCASLTVKIYKQSLFICELQRSPEEEVQSNTNESAQKEVLVTFSKNKTFL